jgi:phosphoadenosine phosphosulfate reductase
VAKLLKWMNPPQGAHIVDAGSGVGEIALLMQAIRPDLTFTLVNISEYQTSLSPKHDGFTRLCADFTGSGLPDGCADVVMFNSALCQMPINQALSEARRLLVSGGQLFVSDMAISEYREITDLYATFMPSAQWCEVIGRHGFELSLLVNDEPCDMRHFSDGFNGRFDEVLPGAEPLLVSFTKRTDWIESTVKRHAKVAFQFSGGKDSLAALYLMRDLWPRMTVYWTNTGDAVPEVMAVIERVRADVPSFVEIAGRVTEQVAAYGLPSDIVPTTSTPFGIDAYGAGVPLQDRFQCCSQALMLPMHQRMQEDGVTLIVRGQKSSDTLKSVLRSGAVDDGIELLFPLEHWNDAQVFEWLQANAFVPDYYEDLAASPDCLTCSAYWSEGRAAWLKAKHPTAYAQYQRKLDVIRGAVMPHIALFNIEVL